MRLRDARIGAGMTMKQLAKASGVTVVSIWRYEHGERKPKLPIAKKLASILHIRWYELLEDENDGGNVNCS